MADELTQIRLAQNQSIFRSSKERIEAAADALGIWQNVPFMCECPIESCTELVQMGAEEYESIRQAPPCSSPHRDMTRYQRAQAPRSWSNERSGTSSWR